VKCTSTGGGGSYGSSGRRAIDADVTSTLPTAPRIGGGNGRLVPALVSSPAASTSTSTSSPPTAALTLGWHDNERKTDCTFTRASDGKMRCLPTGATATVFHTDTACKSPALVAVVGQASCVGGAPFGRLASTTCPVTTRVFALGSETRSLTTASIETAPGHCPTLAGVNNAMDATEVDPAGFVEGVPVAE